MLNKNMFLRNYSRLANDYKIANINLSNALDYISWYQPIPYRERMSHTYYNRLVIKADRLVGEIKKLEKRMDRAYKYFNK